MFTMLESKERYQSVEQHDDGSDDFELEQATSQRAPSQLRWKMIVAVQSLAIVIILVFNRIDKVTGVFRPYSEDAVYTPAWPVVRYQNVKSKAGILSDKTEFQGAPNAENNQLWEDLYSFGLSKITQNEAAQLVNRTIPIVGDPGKYIITLDVFHQLHCLNMMRLFIWNAPDDNGYLNEIHMDHCIDSIRQSLMCSSPITPMPFVWHSDYEAALPPTTGIMKTCRDFDALRDWARERESREFDLEVRPLQDPLGEIIVQDDGQSRGEEVGSRPIHLVGKEG